MELFRAIWVSTAMLGVFSAATSEAQDAADGFMARTYTVCGRGSRLRRWKHHTRAGGS